MAKYCQVCGRGKSHGHKVSFSNKKHNRTWAPNVRRVKAIVEGSPKRIYACTKCLKSGKVTRAL